MDEFFAPVVSSGDALERVTRWANLDEAERKRRAAEACRDRDVATLWDLTEARLILFGKSGSRTSRHTISSYRTSVERLIADWSGVPLLRSTPDQAALWVRTLEKTLAPSTVSVRLAGARALYAALRWTRATDIDPFRDVHPAKDNVAPEDKRQPYSDGAVAALLTQATGSDRLLILLAGHAALRNAECVNLRWEHVDLAARKLLVVEGKNRKTASVDLSRTLAEALHDAPRVNEYVIPEYRTTEQARRRLKAVCLRAGVQPLGVHSLRHACATRLQIQMRDVSRVQRHLRHASPSVTMRYVHLADRALADNLQDW